MACVYEDANAQDLRPERWFTDRTQDFDQRAGQVARRCPPLGI